MEGERRLARRVPARLKPREGRKFAFTVGPAFLVIAGLVLWRGHDEVAFGFGAVGAALLLAGVLVPGRLGPVYQGWMALGYGLSRVVNPIVMAVLYFGVLGPSGLIRRVVGRSPVRRSRAES